MENLRRFSLPAVDGFGCRFQSAMEVCIHSIQNLFLGGLGQSLPHMLL
jgi:hypothetical protein